MRLFENFSLLLNLIYTWQFSALDADGQIDLWIKIFFTLFVGILVPVYWKHWGPANFLWFSDIALLVCVPALWMENRLLGSMMAVGVLLPEVYWNVELLLRVLTRKRFTGLTSYMWDTNRPLFLRLLSLFHVFLPAILILLLVRLGYDDDALYWQTGFAWIVLFLCYKFSPRSQNINWVFGLGKRPQNSIPSYLFLILLMIGYLVLLFLPTHFLLDLIF